MRRGEDNPVNRVLLRESTLQSVVYLQSKVYLQEKEVYELVRAFFKEYLGLDYEFTHEELLIELQNVFYNKTLEDKVLEFLRTISRIEYSDDEFKPEQLKKVLAQFSEIVDVLIKNEKRSGSFFRKLFSWKEKKISEIPADKEEAEEIAEVIEDMEKNVSVDMKKDLFSQKNRPKEERRIINEKEKPKNPLDSKPSDKKSPRKKSVKKEKIPVENNKVNHPKKGVSSGLAALSQELNSRIDKENGVNISPLPEQKIPVKTKIPVETTKVEDIDSLLAEMKNNPSPETYKVIQEKYAELPEDKKAKYYSEVLKVYDLVKK